MSKLKWKNIIVTPLLISSLFFSSNPNLLTAQTVDNLRDQRTEVQAKLQRLANEIKKIQTQISGVKNEANSLKNEIRIYDSQIQSTRLAIEANETQITDKQLQSISRSTIIS